MLDCNDHKSWISGNEQAAAAVRKPATNGPAVQDADEVEAAMFGFLIATSMNTSDSTTLHLEASLAKLLISPRPIISNESQGLYAVYGTRCRRQPAPPLRKILTFDEWLNQSLPMFNLMDNETAASPSVPAAASVETGYSSTEHDEHVECEAQTPIGHIWLNQEWRDSRDPVMVAEFMALTGERDDCRLGEWRIKMLMLLQRMEKNGHSWAHERVEVMRCDI
jgi:hypothetical protein